MDTQDQYRVIREVLKDLIETMEDGRLTVSEQIFLIKCEERLRFFDTVAEELHMLEDLLEAFIPGW